MIQKNNKLIGASKRKRESERASEKAVCVGDWISNWQSWCGGQKLAATARCNVISHWPSCL